MSLQTLAYNGANIKNILGILKQHRWDCFRIKDIDSIKEHGLNRRKNRRFSPCLTLYPSFHAGFGQQLWSGNVTNVPLYIPKCQKGLQ